MITSSDHRWIMLIQIICKLFLEQNNVKHTEIHMLKAAGLLKQDIRTGCSARKKFF